MLKAKTYKYIQKLHNIANIYGGAEIAIRFGRNIIPTLKFDDKIEHIFFLDIDVKTVVLGNNEITTTIYSTIHVHFKDKTSIKFTLIKALSHGANGIVYLYQSLGQNKMYFVGKYAYNNPDGLDDDFHIFEKLQKSNICNDVLVSCYAHHENPKVLLMEYMSADLNVTIRNELSNKSILNLMMGLFTMVNCLIKNKFYYTDIKPGNILVRCNDTDKTTVLLGDLGGIAIENSSYAIATYPSIYYETEKNFKENSGIISYPDASHVMWALGVTFFNLLHTKFLNAAVVELWYSSIDVHKKYYLPSYRQLKNETQISYALIRNHRDYQIYRQMLGEYFADMEKVYIEKIKMYYKEYIAVCVDYFINNIALSSDVKTNMETIFSIMFGEKIDQLAMDQLEQEFASLSKIIQ